MLGCIGPWQETLEPGEDCWLWSVDFARIWWWTALAALWASGARLTSELELVRTRGI